MNEGHILEVKNLTVHYETVDGIVEAVNDVSFAVNHGETFGLVGETGAGKTTTALSVMGLLPVPPSHVIGGEIYLDGENVLEMQKEQLRSIRGGKVSMIFQDPMTALNPVIRVGEQIKEVILLHNKVSKAEAEMMAMDMLETVGIPKSRYKDYPFEFSGGMKQRVVIAIALACHPELLIADEPTTALDVTIQAQVLDLMRNLKKTFNTAMIIITHDFGIIADICEKCAVMYAGEIVEIGTVQHIFDHPLHPYTVGLFNSIPKLSEDVERLIPIPGLVADPTDLPPYCSFHDRCSRACSQCESGNPPLKEIEPGHFVRCFFAEAEA
ncbi:MAG: ABC transporter ATP-binding protein [Oscillospiraceae bacterium]|nr:ABC transporter ATP-binding protein [Oscillospiraceae bacterium]